MKKLLFQTRAFAGAAVAVSALLLVSSGCGSSTPTATISGKVVYKGSVVPGGTVVFVTDKDINKRTRFEGAIDGLGNYSVSGLPVGCTAKVAVVTAGLKFSTAGIALAEKHAVGSKDAAKKADFGADAPKVPRYREIPPKFADPERSGVKVEIKEATVAKDIELK
jgi:hypothetical protein